MNAKEAHARKGEVTFLDVREWYEWEAGTVDGALHIPIRALTRRVEEVPRERPVVVICQVGQRSALAADYLNRVGFEAYNLEGGVESWTAEDLPLVAGSGESGQVVDGWTQTPDLP